MAQAAQGGGMITAEYVATGARVSARATVKLNGCGSVAVMQIRK